MNIKFSILVFLSIVILIPGCNTNSKKNQGISFDDYKIADGFEIQLAASEPLIEAPVTMDFDNQGRMWVVEMRGYMPNIEGIGEDNPSGRITILEDRDKDGVAEHSKTFLDSMVLPRAIAHVYGGLLYAVPPNLWFVEINNDQPGKRTLVDSLYSDVGNVETQPNGLLMNIDNWIYSANSNFRYQLKDGKWKKEPTSFRGQWGISNDDFGRLYYNYNEIQLVGDYVLSNSFIGNPYLKPKEAINKILTDDQRVYPLHATTVNRGSEKGILSADSLLLKFTAACGPLIYRGNQFPHDYYQNAFACEPQGNLIKRDILTFEGVKTTAKQAWNDREFLASTDEGFRPVNLFNGPDGAMYVVDMHRGIMQHRAYATPYYRNEIVIKELDTLMNMGRILRIKNKSKELGKIPDFTKASGRELVSMLKSDNSWIRGKAQQLLIYGQQKSVIPELEKMVQDDKNAVAAIHALHVLDGLNALSFAFLQKAAASADPMLAAHALVLSDKYNTAENSKPMAELANSLFQRNDGVINLNLILSLGAWTSISNETFFPILARLSQAYPDSAIYQEAVISSLNGLEEKFKLYINNINDNKSPNEVLNNLLDQTIRNKKAGKKNPIFVQISIPIDQRTNGLNIFRTTCATCHGVDGGGIENLAPPLKGSQFLEGPTDRLAMVILFGLQGPLHVNGQLYQFNGSMPNFGNNFTDKEIVDIITYLHNSFVPKSKKPVRVEKIKKLRSKNLGTLTEKTLLEMDVDEE